MKSKNSCFIQYGSWKYPSNWGKNIIQFFRNIKWSIQRARRGYSDRDLWDFDCFLIKILIEGLDDFTKNLHAAPYNYYDNENDSIQSWIDKVKEVRQHFATAADEDFWLEDISNEEFRIHEENREKELRKGFEELADIFWDLWD